MQTRNKKQEKQNTYMVELKTPYAKRFVEAALTHFAEDISGTYKLLKMEGGELSK